MFSKLYIDHNGSIAIIEEEKGKTLKQNWETDEKWMLMAETHTRSYNMEPQYEFPSIPRKGATNPKQPSFFARFTSTREMGRS